MGLSGKIYNGVRLIFGQKTRDQCAIIYVALHKNMQVVTCQGFKCIEVAGIGKLVEVHYAQPVSDGLQHKIGPYEASSAGYEQCFHVYLQNDRVFCHTES
jgi:hypothetical protein